MLILIPSREIWLNMSLRPVVRENNESQMPKKDNRRQENGATLGFEEKLWQAADKLQKDMDAAEYKHVVLGLIFLK